jgi:cell division transport system ATP-binding protein
MQFDLQNVTVQFDAIPALASISVHIPSGSMVLVTGPTGSGKTTLLRLLYADVLPSAGAVFANGQRTSSLTWRQRLHLRRRLGICFQDIRLIEELTIFDNILLALRIRQIPTAQARQRALDALVRLGIGYLREKYPAECSMGERHLASIARAIAPAPDCIISDEPTGNLDVDTTALVVEQLRIEHERGATIIVATHDPFFAAHFAATHRLALYEGRLVSSDIPALAP